MPKKFKPQKSSVKNDGKKTAANIFLYGILPILIIFLVLLIYFPIFLKPNHKIIQYQEEVKLSDGSMIWVDIKEYYRLAGEPFQKANYLTNGIEMTWDTGFKNIGKYTIKSNAANSSAIFTLDKHNNLWYIAMTVNRSSDFYKYNNGNEIRNSVMIYVLNQDGHFVSVENIPTLYRNILSYKIGDNRFVHKNPAKFTWQEKIGQFNNDGLAVGNEFYPNPVYSK